MVNWVCGPIRFLGLSGAKWLQKSVEKEAIQHWRGGGARGVYAWVWESGRQISDPRRTTSFAEDRTA